jgi:hypothetical protein
MTFSRLGPRPSWVTRILRSELLPPKPSDGSRSFRVPKTVMGTCSTYFSAPSQRGVRTRVDDKQPVVGPNDAGSSVDPDKVRLGLIDRGVSVEWH